MRTYYIAGSNGSASSNATMATVIAATTVRPRVREIHLGCSQTPGDQAAKHALTRFTAAGTAGSSPTPAPGDPADVASLATAGAGTFSVEPTYTTTVWGKSLHQRQTYVYRAEGGCEFVAPATAANGLGLQLVSATTTLIIDGIIYFFE